jgi:hypothetical protein
LEFAGTIAGGPGVSVLRNFLMVVGIGSYGASVVLAQSKEDPNVHRCRLFYDARYYSTIAGLCQHLAKTKKTEEIMRDIKSITVCGTASFAPVGAILPPNQYATTKYVALHNALSQRNKQAVDQICINELEQARVSAGKPEAGLFYKP